MYNDDSFFTMSLINVVTMDPTKCCFSFSELSIAFAHSLSMESSLWQQQNELALNAIEYIYIQGVPEKKYFSDCVP